MVHFDGLTERHWIEKMYSKSVTSSAGRRNRARTALISFASGPGIELSRMRELFARTMCLTPRRARAMQRHGLVRPLGMDVSAEVGRVLPDLNLSPAAFDAALGERAHTVTWRGVRFHVSLLDSAIEREMALWGTSPDAAMLDRLVARLEGRQIAVLDLARVWASTRGAGPRGGAWARRWCPWKGRRTGPDA